MDTIDQYKADPTVLDLINFKPAYSATPTYNPKRFIEQLYFKDDGTFWAFIGNTWVEVNVDPSAAQFNASKLQDFDISTTDPTSGQALVYSGTAWTPTTLTTTVDGLKSTGTLVGSANIGDLAVYTEAKTSSTITRIASTSGFSAIAPIGTVSGVKFAFKHKPAVDYTCKSIIVNVTKVGSPTDNLRMALYTDSGGSPSALITYTDVATPSTGNVTFTFNQALTAGTLYWVVLERTGTTSNSNYWTTQVNTAVTISSFYSEMTGTKAFNGLSWADYSTSGYNSLCLCEFKGDVSAGWYKWLGYSTNIDFGAFPAIITAINGQTVDLLFSGVHSYTGYTQGAEVSKNSVICGIGIEANKALFHTNKTIRGSYSITTNTSGSVDISLPLGWTYKDYSVTTNGSITTSGMTGAEIKLTYTTTNPSGGSATLNITNQYTTI